MFDDLILVEHRKISLKAASANEFFDIQDVLMVDKLGLPVFGFLEDLSEYCRGKTGIKVRSFESLLKILLGQDQDLLIINLETIFLDRYDLVLSKLQYN